MTTIQDLRVHAQATPDRLAVVNGAQRWTYGELEALANRLAHVFHDQGLRRGDHIATLMGNRTEILAIVWAAWRSGLYLTPMSTALTCSELAYLVQDCDARWVICDAALAPQAAELAAHLKDNPVQWFSLGGPIDAHRALEPCLAQASPEPRPDECPGALMMYTSGTTGAPKGVIRPLLPADWKGTPPFAADLLKLFGVGGTDVRYLSTQPLYHAAALRFALAITAGGGVVHVMARFDAEQALDLLERERITHSQWVPAMFQRLLRLPPSRRDSFKAPTHRCAIHGAAPCSIGLKQSMIDWWGPILLEYYSGSEGVGLSLIDSNESLRFPGSVGRVHKGYLHVLAEPDAPTELPDGEIGLLYFSGVPPFAYYKAPEKTAARTNRRGWQTMGDMGYRNPQGYVYLTDRMDDMIISGGVNVYPQEIEKAILEVAGVAECAVVGVPDDAFGERPVAFVVPDAMDQADELQPRILEHCRQHLGRIKRPDRLEFVDALPRSPTGKLLRRQLRERQNQ
jgi:long-chain acyl-CoA synthetase